MKTASHLADSRPGLAASWSRFWFSPADPFGLHLTRLLTGLLLLAWLLPLAGDIPSMFGLRGWFDQQAYYESARIQNGLQTGPPKPISWSILFLARSSTPALVAIYWASIAVLAAFTVGFATRVTSILAWVIVASFTASPAIDVEIDPMLQMLAFYMALGYLLLGLRDWNESSWGARVFGSCGNILLGRLFGKRDRTTSDGSVGANLTMRLLQVHFAVMVVTSGFHKLQIGDWWSGLAHWYNVYPALTTTMAKAREHLNDPLTFHSWLNIAAYSTLIWQITFPLFAWKGGWWRLVLLGGAVAGWAGLVFLYSMPLFGPAFAIGCLAFLSAGDWAAIGQWMRRVSPLKRVGAWLPQPSQDPWSSAPAREPVGSAHAIRER